MSTWPLFISSVKEPMPLDIVPARSTQGTISTVIIRTEHNTAARVLRPPSSLVSMRYPGKDGDADDNPGQHDFEKRLQQHIAAHHHDREQTDADEYRAARAIASFSSRAERIIIGEPSILIACWGMFTADQFSALRRDCQNC